MDGSAPDAGTAWECGHAYGRKPVVLEQTDFRSFAIEGVGSYNPMPTESATVSLELPYASMDEVVTAVLGALAKL